MLKCFILGNKAANLLMNLGKNGNYNIVLGDETIGKVSLQSDGSWTNMSDANQSNWEYHAAGDDDRTRSQYFTSIDSSRNWGVEI